MFKYAIDHSLFISLLETRDEAVRFQRNYDSNMKVQLEIMNTLMENISIE